MVDSSQSEQILSAINALLKNEAMMKRQRVALTRSQKKEICLLLSQKPPLTQTAVARSYGIKQNTVSNIWNKRKKWLATNDDDEFPTRLLSFHMIETYFLRFGV